MDRHNPKLAAFFDNDDDDQSFPQKPVDDAKLSQYTAGKVRKSRREKDQEAAELKKQEEEEHAARAYAEFLDAFEADEGSKRKTGSNFVKASAEAGTAYTPSAKPSADRPKSSARQRSLSPVSAPALKPKGKRAMDSFLEEIKREQAEREAKYSRHAHGHGRSITAMAAYEGQSGSKDRGDPQTSNIFVANLPPHVTEQILGNFFAKVGPVGSVKVMWPRTDGTVGPGADMTASRRTKNSGLSGFVSFMKRRDAEAALREFDGFEWGGSALRVGWSKAVPIAAKPMYVSDFTHQRSRSRTRSRSRSRSRHRDQRRSRSPYRRSRNTRRGSWSRSRSRSWSRSPRPQRSRRRERSRSYSPRRRRSTSAIRQPLHTEEEAAVTDTFIRAVAAEVKGHDASFEKALRERERANPKYGFLLDKNHRRHAFYRGLLESKHAIEPEFDDDGYNSIYSTDTAEDSEREHSRKNVLGRLARRRFEAMLRALTGKRGEMARCMTFSLEHAEAAHEVADIIVASLLVDTTAVPRKVARLHLICDILHNSAASVPSAWKFRQEFSSRLGIVFDHLANIYHSFPGRITAETFKKQITAVVDIWEDWIVFTPDFTTELRARLEGAPLQEDTQQAVPDAKASGGSTDTYQSKFKASTFKLAEEPPSSSKGDSRDGEPMDVGSDVDVDGEPADDVDGEPVDDVDGDPVDDVDGEPVDDVDGEPVDGEDGAPIDDIDGEPLGDLDGAPIVETEDVDGVPMDEDSS